MKPWLVMCLVAMGCSPYMSAGYDASSNVHGQLGKLVTQPAATARLASSAPAPAPVPPGRNYAFSAGGGGPAFGIDVGLQLHDTNSLALPTADGVDPSSPRYLVTTASVDLRARYIKLGPFALNLHAGPAGALLLDRTSGGHDLGDGFRVGTSATITYGRLSVFLDLYEIEMLFADGPATGSSELQGVTLGIIVR